MRNKEYIKEEIKVLETNSMDFNKVFDVFKYVIDNKNVNEIIITEDKIEIKINSKNHWQIIENNINIIIK